MQPTFTVWADWDGEAGVWYTVKSTIPGLHSSGETFEELRQRLLLIIPDFLEDEMPEKAVLNIVAQSVDRITRSKAEAAE